LSLSAGGPIFVIIHPPATALFSSVAGTYDHKETTGQEHQSNHQPDIKVDPFRQNITPAS
jgi:hypothetical protein